MNWSVTLPRMVLCLLALAGLSGCGQSESGVTTPPAFIERIQPSTFRSAELAFDEQFSQTHELVFLRTNFGKPASALAFKAEPDGNYTMYFGSTNAAGEWQHVTTTIEQRVGQQVLRAVEIKLHRNVVINTQRRDVRKNDGDLWIHQHTSDGGLAAGYVPFAATLGNDQASVFLNDLLGQLERLAAAEPEAQAELLANIDQLATKIILTDSP